MASKSSQKGRKQHGRRLRALEDAFHRTVKYALRPLEYEQFQDQFPVFDEMLVQDLYSGYKQARPAVPACRHLVLSAGRSVTVHASCACQRCWLSARRYCTTRG